MATMVYRTLHDFDGLDDGQRLYGIGYLHNHETHQMHAVSDQGDAERDVKTWLIENTDYVDGDAMYCVDESDNIGNLGTMMRSDENVRIILDQIVTWTRDNWNHDDFRIDDVYLAGYAHGIESTSTDGIQSQPYHYQCGYVHGMKVNLARMTGAEPNFIRTWLVPYKAFSDPYGTHELATV